MAELFLFVGLPYLSLTVLVVGSIYRFRSNPFGYSALSSQFLESRKLLWGSAPWHLGILIILVGHLLPLLFPSVWLRLTAYRAFLLAVEGIGVAAALLCLAGLTVLILRRLVFAGVQRVTTTMDLVVLALLLGQVATGLTVALRHRWGAQWSPGTLTPYLWSLLTLRPDLGFISGMPPLVKIHLVGAWLIFLALPFSRLVHLFSLPLRYLWRPPQKVIWTTIRRLETRSAAAHAAFESRRHLLKGALGSAAAAALLSAGTLDKLARFFLGPRMSHDDRADQLQKRLERLQMAAEQRTLELERLRNPYIRVASVAELSPIKGKYFTDYQMRPALAFREAETGLPILISAKCTHLGCTIASDADAKGRLLCPCHVSYFDIATGVPNPGSPAKAPLPILGWALMDSQGEVLARRFPNGRLEGEINAERLETASVYIVREFASEAAS